MVVLGKSKKRGRLLYGGATNNGEDDDDEDDDDEEGHGDDREGENEGEEGTVTGGPVAVKVSQPADLWEWYMYSTVSRRLPTHVDTGRIGQAHAIHVYNLSAALLEATTGTAGNTGTHGTIGTTGTPGTVHSTHGHSNRGREPLLRGGTGREGGGSNGGYEAALHGTVYGGGGDSGEGGGGVSLQVPPTSISCLVMNCGQRGTLHDLIDLHGGKGG
jgi:hypothetical protein